MVRHAMGIIWVFFPETHPDLKSTEVRGSFLSYFPSLWALHKAADPSPWHHKMPPPLLYCDALVPGDGVAELITVGTELIFPGMGVLPDNGSTSSDLLPPR